jgi:hypothetical protein
VEQRFVVVPRVLPQQEHPGRPPPHPRFSGHPQEKAMKKNEDRAVRGGSWGSASTGCRASFRGGFAPVGRCFNLGFRVVLSSPQDRFPSAISPSNLLPPGAPESA